MTRDVSSQKIHCPSASWYETPSLEALLNQFLDCAPESPDLELLPLTIESCLARQKNYFYQHLSADDTMAQAIILLNQLATDQTIITADAGNHLLDAATLLHPDAGHYTLLLNDGIRSMGSGICETVGMAFADPSKHYIAVTGDGCMLMNGNVMYTAMRSRLPVLFLVCDNASLGRVRVGQLPRRRVIASSLGNADFVGYAHSMGISAVNVSSLAELEHAVCDFLSSPRPTAVVYSSDPDEIPPTLKAKGVWN